MRDARIEKLARRMCKAAGNDPDLLVVSANQPLQRLAGRGDWCLIPNDKASRPAWTLWSADAEVVVSMLDETMQMLWDSTAFGSKPQANIRAV